MKACAWAAAALILCAGDARAAPPGSWAVTGIAENDVFDYSPNHTDRYYTHGTQISGTSGPIPCQSTPVLAKVSGFLERTAESCRAEGGDLVRDKGDLREAPTGSPIMYRWGLEAGQNIYTPASKTGLRDEKDRPYAGWAYGGVTLGSYSAKEANTIELQLGIVGPSSGAAWVQDHFHDLIRARRFLGWDHQLRDEVAFDVLGERRWRPYRYWPRDPSHWDSLALDSTDHLDFAIGTVQDSVAIGRAYRLGFGLGSDYGPPRIRPAPSGSAFIMQEHKWSAYVFAGLDGRAVARNIFLDGNTFLSSPHIAKRWWVWEATSGAEVRWRGLRVGYTYVWQSEEFLGQRGPQKFGSWSVTLLPCAYWKGCGL